MIVLSPLPDTSFDLSGEKATEEISALCPLSFEIHLFDLEPHILILESKLPEAILMSSSENVTEDTPLKCAEIVVLHFPDYGSQILMVLS